MDIHCVRLRTFQVIERSKIKDTEVNPEKWLKYGYEYVLVLNIQKQY